MCEGAMENFINNCSTSVVDDFEGREEVVVALATVSSAHLGVKLQDQW